MVVGKVRLVNFRNHEDFVMDFRKKTTVITGGNGWGKTSILEAIYLGLMGKSFRGVDAEMVRRGAEFYRVDVGAGKEGTRVVRYDGRVRSFEVLGKRTARLPRGERYPVVLFLPSDLHLVGSSPTRRRDYFDGVGAELDEGYRAALLKYNRALKQRNEGLKRPGCGAGEVFAWNVMLARCGVVVAEGRRRLATAINGRLSEVYRGIADTDDRCEVRLASVALREEGYLAEMERRFEMDRVLGHTSYGVHRDEWGFWFNGERAEGNASRGETRSMVLALKFIEAEMMEGRLMRKPLVLLDDVLSELDEVRRGKIMENFGGNQVIMTGIV